MKLLQNLFKNNEAWASHTLAEDPGFFDRLVHQHAPQFFWIGCSDSRVPATQIVGLPPGEVFVHRNVANLVAHLDLNSQSALQYATDSLGVKHIMIVGHYGCGGVRAAMQDVALPQPLGHWLEPVRQIYQSNRARFDPIEDEQTRWDLLCELNVIAQVATCRQMPIVQNAWERGQALAIHGWIYSVRDGRLRDLNVTISPELENTKGGRSRISTGAALIDQ